MGQQSEVSSFLLDVVAWRVLFIVARQREVIEAWKVCWFDRCLESGVGAHGWVAGICQSRGRYSIRGLAVEAPG